jgi:hypothetical protein
MLTFAANRFVYRTKSSMILTNLFASADQDEPRRACIFLAPAAQDRAVR